MTTTLTALTVLMLAAGKPLPPLTAPPPKPPGPAATTPPPATPPPSSAPASTGTGQAGTGSPSSAPPVKAGAYVGVIETLYKKQQYEAADIVLGKALNDPATPTSDKVQLHVLEGMLRMESFQEPQARKAFTEALTLDREAILPDFAPPATRALFLDVKATLPLTTTPSRPSEPPAKPKPPRPVRGPYDELFPYIPIGLGGVTLLTGGGFVVASRVVDTSLRTGSPSINSADALRAAVANGKTYQTAGYVMVGVGGAVLVGGLVWKFAPDVAPLLSVNVAPTDHGFAAVVSGSLP